MYSKQEAAKQREAFWTTFGQYMRPVLSADGEKVNWVNYKTGIVGVRFEMDVDNTHARIGIVLSQQDTTTQESYYNQLLQLKHILEDSTGEVWQWEPAAQDEYGKPIKRIGIELSSVNIYKKDDWPQIISFFKERMIALDAFWSMVRYGLE